MSQDSAIEWTEATWNPVTGCTRASAGCDNCYAVTMTHRLEAMGQADYAGLTVLNGRGKRHFNGVVRCHEDRLAIPLKRRKPTVYFVNSMSDLFHKDVPFEFIDKVFAVMALTPQHTYQVLTKRPDRMAKYKYWERRGQLNNAARDLSGKNWIAITPTNEHGMVGERFPLSNVWLGTSVESKSELDRVEHLQNCRAAVRFISAEPLLGPLDFFYGPQDWGLLTSIHWLIVGGESGPGARPCNVEWIRSIIQQGKAAGVPVFVKQLGARPYDPAWHGDGTPAGSKMMLNNKKGGDMAEWPEDLRVREYPGCLTVDLAE